MSGATAFLSAPHSTTTETTTSTSIFSLRTPSSVPVHPSTRNPAGTSSTIGSTTAQGATSRSHDHFQVSNLATTAATTSRITDTTSHSNLASATASGQGFQTSFVTNPRRPSLSTIASPSTTTIFTPSASNIFPSSSTTLLASTTAGSTTPTNSAYITSSLSDAPTPIQSTSIESESSSDPSATSILVPGASPTVLSAHNIIIDSGACAGLGLPKVVISGGDPLDLTPLGDNQYTATLEEDETGTGGVYAFLADDVCASVVVDFNPSVLTVSVSRKGDRGKTMYPMSIWVDGGELFDSRPADSLENKYNCWGWPESDCPFSCMYTSDPYYTISTTNLNASVHITFCPFDGPAVSSVGQNPNPPGWDPDTQATNLLITTTTTVPVSAFLVPLTPGRGHGFITAPQSEPTSTGFAALDINTTPTQTETIFNPYCLTDTAIHCFEHFTMFIINQTSTILLGEPFLTEIPKTTTTLPDYGPTVLFPTYFNLGTTKVVPLPTVVPSPTRPRTGITSSTRSTPTTIEQGSALPSLLDGVSVPTTLTDSLGVPTATSMISRAIIPTFSVVANSRGSVITSVAYNLTTIVQPTPPPEIYYTLTSWTTYMTVNGSTMPAIGGQVGVLTTVPATFVLEPETTIAIEVLSSISAESTRTSLPSTSAKVDTAQVASTRGSAVAAIIVGSLVGVTILGAFLWMVCAGYRRRQQRTQDYAAHQSPAWSSVPESVGGTGSRNERSTLDLSSEPQPRQSFVEPWVERQPPSHSRKMQREMEQYDGTSTGAGPSRSRNMSGTNSALGRSYAALRASKSANRVPPELRPEPLAHWPVHNDTLSSIHSSRGFDHASAHSPSAPSTPARSLVRSAAAQHILAPTSLSPDSVRPQYSGEINGSGPHHDAIPPLYNESWNVRQTPIGE